MKNKKNSSEKNRKPVKKAGVIETIMSLIENAKKPIGITKDQLVAGLSRKFPDRESESLRMTVNSQVPGRLSREKKVKVVRTEEGGYLLSHPKAKAKAKKVVAVK